MIPTSTLIFALMAVFGFLLMMWARVTLESAGICNIDYPTFATRVLLTAGPYRFVSHPGYVGAMLFVMGLAGLAAGWWNVLAVGTVCELLLREWAVRERGHFKGWHR